MVDEINGRVTLALLGQHLQNIATQIEQLSAQVKAVSDGGKERDNRLVNVGLLLRDYRDVEKKVDFMYPWVSGVRWFAIIAGGIVAVGIVTGVLWAVAQSGAWLP